MYLKQKSMKSVSIICVLTLVLLASMSIEAKYQGNDVDDIYAGIRNSSFKYEWDESIVEFTNEGMNVVCTLTIPRTQKKCPIAISLNGFTGNRNDLVIPGTDEPFFQRLSRILAENGIASLRVDFRGSGDSDGGYEMTSFSTQISDATAAIDYIWKNLKHKVNRKAIGIIGYSQGGLVAAVTAARDRRVKGLVLWSPVANAPSCYEGLLSKEGITEGLSLAEGAHLDAGMYIGGQYVGSVPLGKEFYSDIFEIDPVAEITKFKHPLMVIVGNNDIVVWPQPYMGNLYLDYHKGDEKLVVMDSGHAFNFALGAEGPDTAFYWSTAWLIKSFKKCHNRDD